MIWIVNLNPYARPTADHSSGIIYMPMTYQIPRDLVFFGRGGFSPALTDSFHDFPSPKRSLPKVI